jgi:hypothetical protein
MRLKELGVVSRNAMVQSVAVCGGVWLMVLMLQVTRDVLLGRVMCELPLT